MELPRTSHWMKWGWKNLWHIRGLKHKDSNNWTHSQIFFSQTKTWHIFTDQPWKTCHTHICPNPCCDAYLICKNAFPVSTTTGGNINSDCVSFWWAVTSFVYHWWSAYSRLREYLSVIVHMFIWKWRVEGMLVVSLCRIQRVPEDVVGVDHESGTKAYLHIPIIPPPSQRWKLSCCRALLCVFLYILTALPLNFTGCKMYF